MSTSDAVKAFILAEYLPGTPAEELDPGYDLLDNGVVDSLGLLRLVVWIGQHFQIAVDELDISPENFRSVNEICHFVEHAAKKLRSRK
jgi:methoxymalonate biosynthesis acyl carrier protein